MAQNAIRVSNSCVAVCNIGDLPGCGELRVGVLLGDVPGKEKEVLWLTLPICG